MHWIPFVLCLFAGCSMQVTEGKIVRHISNAKDGFNSLKNPGEVTTLVVQYFPDEPPLSDPEILSGLKQFRGVTSLLLVGTDISDKSIPAILALPVLSKIAVIGGRITDQGVRTLAASPRMKLIVVWENEAGFQGEEYVRSQDKSCEIEVLKGNTSGDFVDLSGCPTGRLLEELGVNATREFKRIATETDSVETEK